MSGLKYLVVGLFVGTVFSYPHNQRNVRSLNFQQHQPMYSYPNQYPNQYPYQSYQPSFGYPNFQMGGFQQIPFQSFPYPQSNSWGMPSYPSYGSGYPMSYPSSYPSYPFQQRPFQTQPDPYAHIPTEIIDVDANGNFDIPHSQLLPNSNVPFYPGLNWGGVPVLPEFNETHLNQTVNNTNSQPLDNTYREVHTNTDTSQSTTTITRTFDSDSSDPKVDITTYSKPETNPGSGTLIVATEGEEEEDTENKVNSTEEGDEETNDENPVTDKTDQTTAYSMWGK